MTFKQRLSQKPIITAPGVFDALSALLAEQAGFEAAFVSGSAVAFTALAEPDIGLVTATEMVDVLGRIRERTSLSLIVDADSGHGNALNVQRTVRTLERAGADGIQIEDQLNTKRPAQVKARPLVSAGEMVGKIKAALDARDNDATVISARCDAMFTEGLDGALRRAEAYVAAGPDMLFVEGMKSAEERAALCKAFAGSIPLLFNVLDPSSDSAPTAQELETEGYAIVLYPGVAVQSAARGMMAALADLKTAGTADPPLAMETVIGGKDRLAAGERYDSE